MNVYVVVPVYGRLDLTKRFYKSLSSQIKNLYFIVVDDEEVLYENYVHFSSLGNKNVIALKTEGEQWWCGTTRIGIKWILSNKNINKSDVIVIANNDVTLPKGQFDKISSYISDDIIVHPRTFSDNGEEISSGCKVRTWFPYITKHPIGKFKELENIDLCNARFMCLRFSTLEKIGNIAINLIQYHGDYDFSLRAKGLGIKSYILNSAHCKVYDDDTGDKMSNLTSLRALYSSFYSIRSTTNLKSRYNFLRNHFSMPFSCLILVSMILNMVLKILIFKTRK